MPKSSKSLHKDFLNKVRELNVIRNSFENAITLRSINSIDILQAYAGLYFDLFTDFERSIEALFLGLLNGEIKHSQTTVKRNLKISPKLHTENVLFAGKKYIDWLPYDKTLTLAKIYFVNKLPFDQLVKSDTDDLSAFLAIRNAIGHKSKSSITEFNKMIASLTLLPIERTPSGYLRNIPNPSAGQTQFEVIATKLESILKKLCH